LLFVQSGGLTRLAAPSFPASFSCYVAAMVHLGPDVAVDAHKMVMKVKAADTATLVATVKVDLHENPLPRGLAPGEGRQVPIVVPVNKVTFPGPGQYDLQVDIDDEFVGDLSFRIAQRPS